QAPAEMCRRPHQIRAGRAGLPGVAGEGGDDQRWQLLVGSGPLVRPLSGAVWTGTPTAEVHPAPGPGRVWCVLTPGENETETAVKGGPGGSEDHGAGVGVHDVEAPVLVRGHRVGPQHLQPEPAGRGERRSPGQAHPGSGGWAVGVAVRTVLRGSDIRVELVRSGTATG